MESSYTLPIFDKSQVFPIHQKRILAFVNHFIINTVTFLNKFVVNCESKFIDFERKLQKVEASLLIVESKLASIQGIENNNTAPSQENNTNIMPKETENVQEIIDVSPIIEPISENVTEQELPKGIKTSEDSRYRKYFKMLQFGVPMPAVKLKMSAEGFDCNLLDFPDKILEDGIARIDEEEN